MYKRNFILRTDGYKLTHWKQLPPKTTKLYSYEESRGGQFPTTSFFGLQYYVKKYLSGKVFDEHDIERARIFAANYFGRSDYFNYDGWTELYAAHGGTLPLEIRAVKEGAEVETSNVLFTVENSDDRFPWLTNVVEPLVLKTWYPTTVGTLSLHMKKYIEEALVRSGEPTDAAEFMLHDFGYRGVSSEESAEIGGASHLIHFKGSDTLIANEFIEEFYRGDICSAVSVPAAEHSTITSWGRNGELDAYRNMLAQYPTGIVSIVCDSYDTARACKEMFGGVLKDVILNRNGITVPRGDSGDPKEILSKMLAYLSQSFGYEMNEAGYNRLNPKLKLLWGDGINYFSGRDILNHFVSQGWSAANFVLGMGGGLLQQVNRDTQKFAIKCSSVTVDGQQRDVYKDPVTDAGKASKRGKLGLFKSASGYITVNDPGGFGDQLELVFKDGKVMRDQSFAEIREIAAVGQSELALR